MAVLVAPAFMPANGVEKGCYGITDVIQTARAYAAANNTYVYLGFAEYDGTKPANGPQTAGSGRVVVAAVATLDGTRGYAITSASGGSTSWTSSYALGANLVIIIRPQVFENLHIADLGAPPTTGPMTRPDPGTAWRLSSTTFSTQTPFTLPLGNALNTGQYTFSQVLILLPNGSIGGQSVATGLTSPLYMEVGIQPFRGNTTANYAAISINGTTAASRIYRP